MRLEDFERWRGVLEQVLIFGLVAAVWVGFGAIWVVRRSRQRQVLEQRLYTGKQNKGDEKILRLWRDGETAEALVPGDSKRSLLQWLDELRQDAGWETSMPVILLQVLGATGVVGLAVLVVTGNPVLGVTGGVAVLMIFRAYLLRRLNNRAALFDKQLVDALDLGARSLRAGHPLSGAFKLIAQQIGAPINAVFAEIVDREALGSSVQQALKQAGQRSRSQAMKIFSASVVIQLRSGGNFAEMMDRVSWVVRDRMKLNRRARVLTAEAQLSKWVLIALPVSLFVVMNVMNSEYMRPFFSTRVGGIMLLIGGAMLCVGAWIMNRMATLRY